MEQLRYKKNKCTNLRIAGHDPRAGHAPGEQHGAQMCRGFPLPTNSHRNRDGVILKKK